MIKTFGKRLLDALCSICIRLGVTIYFSLWISEDAFWFKNFIKNEIALFAIVISIVLIVVLYCIVFGIIDAFVDDKEKEERLKSKLIKGGVIAWFVINIVAVIALNIYNPFSESILK